MICTTCGKDNPGHLTFCEQCGQRLARRVAPPTPPVGVSPAAPDPGAVAGASPLAATAFAPDASVSPPSRSRPPAPQISFGPPRSVGAAPPAAPMACPLCGSSNQPGLRFCVTCGHLLAQPPPPAATPPAARPPADMLLRTVPDAPTFESAAPAPAYSPPVPPVAPVLAMEVVPQAVVAQPQRACPRCRAAADATSQFCRFCGASLASVAPRPSPSPLAPPPPAPAYAPPPAPSPPNPPAPSAPPPAPATRNANAIAAAPSRGRIVLIARDGSEGAAFPLGETTDIGRTEGNVVIADDRYISPRHARIVAARRDGTVTLRDLESTNGVFVRIPFERSSVALAGQMAGPRDESGMAGPRETPQNSGSGEQLLVDQDLFLVGQQVLRFEVVKHAEEGFGVASENGTLLFGTPAAPRYARLSQRTVEGVVRDVFYVRKAETIVGREQGDIVFTDDPFLSRRHCVLRAQQGGAPGAAPRAFTLADLGSSNGTFLQAREEVRLRPGDHFRIGQQLFRFDT